jgi:cob(I)alamin adenosyltransferase
VSIATKRGDRGTTGLLYGGRVRKDSVRIECNGAVDEAQSALGLARADGVAARAAGPAG